MSCFVVDLNSCRLTICGDVALHYIYDARKTSLTDANNHDSKRHYDVVFERLWSLMSPHILRKLNMCISKFQFLKTEAKFHANGRPPQGTSKGQYSNAQILFYFFLFLLFKSLTFLIERDRTERSLYVAEACQKFFNQALTGENIV